jgi:hypothetical protein
MRVTVQWYSYRDRVTNNEGGEKLLDPSYIYNYCWEIYYSVFQMCSMSRFLKRAGFWYIFSAWRLFHSFAKAIIGNLLTWSDVAVGTYRSSLFRSSTFWFLLAFVCHSSWKVAGPYLCMKECINKLLVYRISSFKGRIRNFVKSGSVCSLNLALEILRMAFFCILKSLLMFLPLVQLYIGRQYNRCGWTRA